MQFFNFPFCAAVCGISKKAPVDMHKMLLPVIRLDISSDNVRATQPATWPGLAKVQILQADVEKLEMFRQRLPSLVG